MQFHIMNLIKKANWYQTKSNFDVVSYTNDSVNIKSDILSEHKTLELILFVLKSGAANLVKKDHILFQCGKASQID